MLLFVLGTTVLAHVALGERKEKKGAKKNKKQTTLDKIRANTLYGNSVLKGQRALNCLAKDVSV